MPSWHHNPEEAANRIEAGDLLADKSMSDSEFLAPLLDPDSIEVPEPYTETEWSETEGSLENRVSGSFRDVDPAPFIDGWYNRDPE